MTNSIDDFNICENYGIPDYRDVDAYQYFKNLGQGALKWELLRRSYSYRQNWDVYHCIAAKNGSSKSQSVANLHFRFLYQLGVHHLISPTISSDPAVDNKMSLADSLLLNTYGFMQGDLSGTPNARKKHVTTSKKISHWSIFDELLDGAEELTRIDKITSDVSEKLTAASKSGMMLFLVNPFADTDSLTSSITTQIEQRRTDDQIHKYNSEGELTQNYRLGWAGEPRTRGYTAHNIQQQVHALDAELQGASRRSVAEIFDKIYPREFIDPSGGVTKVLNGIITAGLDSIWNVLGDKKSPRTTRWNDGKNTKTKGLRKYRLRRSPWLL